MGKCTMGYRHVVCSTTAEVVLDGYTRGSHHSSEALWEVSVTGNIFCVLFYSLRKSKLLLAALLRRIPAAGKKKMRNNGAERLFFLISCSHEFKVDRAPRTHCLCVAWQFAF